MSENKSTKSPLGLRIFIGAGGLLLTLLLIWLLGFILSDVGEYRDINSREIEKQFVSQEDLDREKALERQVSRLESQIRSAQQQEASTKQTRDMHQQTIDQMFEMQRMSLEKGVPIAAEQQAEVDRAQQGFVDSQKEIQNHIERSRALNEEKAVASEEQATLDEKLREARTKAREEEMKQRLRRDLIAGLLKALILLPAAALAAWLFVKMRSTAMAPIVYAVCFSVLWWVVAVIHDHFPSDYYKYIFLIAAVAAVLKILLVLIKSAAKPARQTLIKRYREAYRKSQCPVCGYPMASGRAPFAQLARILSSKSFNITGTADVVSEQPYTCPSCGQALFEACDDCGKLRHTLLPNCRHCGSDKDLAGAE